MVVLFLILPLLAQDNSLDFSAGLSMSRGNSESTRFYGRGIVSLKRRDTRFIISSNYIYGKGRDGVDTNQGKLTVSTEKLLWGRWRLISSAAYFFDRLANIQGRVDFSMGINYTVEERPRNKFSISASYSEEYEAYFTKTSLKKSRRLAFQMSVYQRLDSGAQFNLGALYTPSLLDLSDFRFEGEASVKVLMKKPFWLNFSLSERFNNQPPLATLKKNDIILLTSLEITI